MHRVILHAIDKKWPDLGSTDTPPVEGIYERDGASIGRYAMIPLNTVRPKMKEDVIGCARRTVFQELRSVIAGETKKYSLEGGDALAEAAVEELFSVMAPDHPVLVVKESAEDQSIAVFVSLNRMKTQDMTINKVIRELSKASGGTQLMLLPYQTGTGDLLPQLPAFCANGLKGGELMDNEVFERRCEKLFISPADREQYHPSTNYKANDMRKFPKDIAVEILSV
jgi:hypothetical protein